METESDETNQNAENNFQCENCHKYFASAWTLKKHYHTVHEGHKDYKCDTCNKLFTSAFILKMHIRDIHDDHEDYC